MPALVTLLLTLLPTVLQDIPSVIALIATITNRQGSTVDQLLAQAGVTLSEDDKKALAEEVRLQAEIAAGGGK